LEEPTRAARQSLRCVVAGVLATLVMDAGGGVLRALHLTVGLPPNLIGRWFVTLVREPRVVTTIADVPAVPGELAIALAGHYCIGIALTVAFLAALAATGRRGERRFAFAAALVFGLLTNLLPWLWMFPAMGYGRFGRAAPAEWALTTTSFVNHLIFAIGLACATRWLRLVGAETGSRGGRREHG